MSNNNPEAPFTRKPWTRTRVQSAGGGESVCDRSLAAATDVNYIVEKYQRTGQLPPGRPGTYADVTHMQGDLTERLLWAQNIIEETKRDMEALELDKQEQLRQAQEAVEQPPAKETPTAPETLNTPE